MNYTPHFFLFFFFFFYSEELDRRTKETQRLQDEVENATKLTLERFGCVYGSHSSAGPRCHNHRFNVCEYQRQPNNLFM